MTIRSSAPIIELIEAAKHLLDCDLENIPKYQRAEKRLRQAIEATSSENDEPNRDLLKALHIYDDAFTALSQYVGHTKGRTGEEAHRFAVKGCEKAMKAQAILDKYLRAKRRVRARSG